MSPGDAKLIIGFITYGDITLKYMPYFLESLKKQTFQKFSIFVTDNSFPPDNKNVNLVKKYFPEAEVLQTGKNLGFSRAYNLMIKKASRYSAKFFLALNPDIIMEDDAIEVLINAFDDKNLSALSPKLMRWDFKNNIKTNIIDTCGIQLLPGLRFVDVGQGKTDNKEFYENKIIGPSGAAAMYRFSDLERMEDLDNYYMGEGGEYFDELMFMYKEDCDLAYRMNLLGLKAECVPNSVMYHDRSAHVEGQSVFKRLLNRRQKSPRVRSWSFLNQRIIFLKYWRLQNWKNKFRIIVSEISMFFYVLIFESFLLKEYKKLWKIRKQVKVKK